jgi:hypothetical protein
MSGLEATTGSSRQKGLGGVPNAFLFYLIGVLILVVLARLPSEVHTTYTWYGAIIYILLLVGLARGSNICRMILCFLGVLWAIGVALLLTQPIDAVAAIWSAVAGLTSALLLTPSMRRYTTTGRLM